MVSKIATLNRNKRIQLNFSVVFGFRVAWTLYLSEFTMSRGLVSDKVVHLEI